MDVVLTDYQAALDYLFARTTGAVRFGLERTHALLDALGRPERRYPVIHVAGTNGKGSAVATADALLRSRGLRVGRYTSPHLVDFRERIAVDGEAIAPDAVVEFIARHTPLVERLNASFFEATTALAFQHFADAAVDVAVVETGLGGRLDSTNVVRPVVAGVTSIGFDHMEYLGGTLREIAGEKAGIFKSGVPAVIGAMAPDVCGWLAEAARHAGASAIRSVAEDSRLSDVAITASGTTFRLRALNEDRVVTSPLVGLHQAANFAFTLALLDAAGAPFAVSLAEAARAVSAVRLPGRFQRSGRWLFDVAHNPDGARTLAASLAALADGRDVTMVLCVLGDKDWRAMLDALGPVATRFVLTDAPSAPAGRRWDLRAAAAHAREHGYDTLLEPRFDAALRRAQSFAGTLVVTGSFHTVGDAMSRLLVDPLAP